MDAESIPHEPAVNPRIGLYEKGERNAIEWYDSYIGAAWELSDRVANLGLDVGDNIPYSVKVIIPEGMRTSDDDRTYRREFLDRLDRIGINYSVVFVEEESEAPVPEASTISSLGPPKESSRRSHGEDEPIERLVQDFSRRRDEIRKNTEEQRVELDSRLSKGQIEKKQYEAKKKELLKTENESLDELRQELDRQLKGKPSDDESL